MKNIEVKIFPIHVLFTKKEHPVFSIGFLTSMIQKLSGFYLGDPTHCCVYDEARGLWYEMTLQGLCCYEVDGDAALEYIEDQVVEKQATVFQLELDEEQYSKFRAYPSLISREVKLDLFSSLLYYFKCKLVDRVLNKFNHSTVITVNYTEDLMPGSIWFDTERMKLNYRLPDTCTMPVTWLLKILDEDKVNHHLPAACFNSLLSIAEQLQEEIL